MREDPTKSDSFVNSTVWGRQKYTEEFIVSPETLSFESGDQRNELKFVSNSLSGNERNRLFMKTGDNFADVSLLSGADDLADARSFSLIDFNNDGWLDIALMSLNTPRFKLYRNEFGKLFPGNHALRIRLVGGHDTDRPTESLSNRDGIGARVTVKYRSGAVALYQKQAGEGFGSQNSSTIRIGCTVDDAITSVDVKWPSGKTQSIDGPDMTEILTIKEVTQ